MNRVRLIERLESDYSFDPESRYDDDGNVIPYIPSTCYERSKRIRAIIRRLWICPSCRGTTISFDATVISGVGDCPCEKCNGTGRVEDEIMTAAELNQAFAREVVGYKNAAMTTGGLNANPQAAMGGFLLPDYTKDWNAVIGVLERRGLEWEKNHSSWLPAVGAKKVRVGTFQVRRIPKEKEPSGFWYAVDQEPDWGPCHALCLAAVRCVRAMEAIK